MTALHPSVFPETFASEWPLPRCPAQSAGSPVGHLWDEAVAGSPRGALFADCAWNAVALAHSASSGERLVDQPAQSGLDPWQKRRSVEHLCAHISEIVTLASLATATNLSTFHFARAFKQTTDLAPFAFLRHLRAERAIELLGSNEVSISEIAPAVGHETPQAFPRVFRAKVGASPSEYRRERRS